MPKRKRANAKGRTPPSQFTPRSALNDPTWIPITLVEQLSVAGGNGKAPLVVETNHVDVSGKGEEVAFVRLAKNAAWLLKAVGGKQLQKGGLKRTRLLQTLEDMIKKHQNAAVADAADAAGQDDDDDDPMEALQESVTPLLGKVRKYEKKRGRDKIVRLSLPLYYEPAHAKGQTYEARVLPTGSNTIWLHKLDIPWLVCYMVDEYNSGGVQGLPADDDEDKPNCSVQGLCIEWDFESNDRFLARWVSGPFKGERNDVYSSVSSVTAEKWARANGEELTGKPFGQESCADRKTVVWKLLEMHCGAELQSFLEAGGTAEAATADLNELESS